MMAVWTLAMTASAHAVKPPRPPAPAFVRKVPTRALAPALDRDMIRASNHFLPDAAFASKWAAAKTSPLLFFRSFPNAFYRDLRGVAGRVPGGTGVVMGDAHLQNFGFIKTAGGTEYVFNDFDDSGHGPVAIDALRYFTALRLANPNDKKMVTRTLDAYVTAVKDGGGAHVAVPKSLEPHWGDLHKETLDKFTSKESFRYSDKDARLSPAAPETATQVRALVQSDARFGGGKVLDVAVRERDFGGSGGLERFWVLVKTKDDTRILELKEAGPAAVAELGGQPAQSPGKRLTSLKQTFMEDPDAADIFSVKLGQNRFVVRDRSRMANVDPETLSKGSREEVFAAQAAVMANIHHEGWAGVDKRTIVEWLDLNSEKMAKRWEKAYDDAQRAK